MSKSDMPSAVCVDEPDIGTSVFVADGVQIMGTVHLGESASVWYNAVLRGDINTISIGKRTNIQDGTIIHLENDRPCVVGDDVTVGHRAILHGCTIEDGCLVGMGAIILNGAVVKRGAVIGAGAVVKEHMIVPENTLAVGVPAKIIRDLGPESYDANVRWAAKYVQLAVIHKDRRNE